MSETFAFDRFEIDTGTYELLNEGTPVAVEPLVLDLLLLLAQSGGKLVTREDMVERIWDGRFVSDSTISTAVKSARKALGDKGAEQKFIRTVRGRGFQFMPEVRSSGAAPVTASVAIQPSLYLRVGTFDPELEGAPLRALEGRLRTILNRVPLLRIAAPFAGARGIEDPRTLYSDRGITHLAEITLSRSTVGMQADIGLIETLDGLQKWARTVQVKDVAGAQEILIHQIVAHFEPAMVRSMIEMLSSHGIAENAKSLVLQAMGLLSIRGWNRESFRASQDILEKAIELDGSLALAHAYSSLVQALGFRVGILRDDENIKEQALLAADKALELENHDSIVLGLTGCALCDVGQLDRGMPILDRAIELNPANGHAYAAKGAAKTLLHDFEGAISDLEEGIRISPADGRLAVWGAILAMAQLFSGRLEEAAKSAQDAVSRDDKNYMPRLAQAAVLAAAGDNAGVERCARDLLRIHPKVSHDEVLFFVGQDLSVPVWDAVTEVSGAS